MTTKEFLEESKHAIETLLGAIWHEHNEINRLRPILQQLEKQVQTEYDASQHIALNAERPGDIATATGSYWDTYFGPDKERHQVANELEQKQNMENAHEFSRSTMAGAILQIAKQAIGIGHGSAGWATGRLIGTKHLGEIVRQARNQAMHWEEGNLSAAVLATFAELNGVVPGKGFDSPLVRSLAFEVIEVLGWNSYDAIMSDLGGL